MGDVDVNVDECGWAEIGTESWTGWGDWVAEWDGGDSNDDRVDGRQDIKYLRWRCQC